MIAVTAAVGALSFLLVGMVLSFARRAGAMDTPGARSSHATPTPTGGGLGLVGAIAIVGLLAGPGPLAVSAGQGAYPGFWPAVVLLALGLSLVGFIDDVRGVPAAARFVLQLLAAAAALAILGRGFGPVSGPGSGPDFGPDFGAGYGVPFIAVTLVLTWTMNAYNFMDGSNGMAGLQGMFSGVLLAVLFGIGGQPELGFAAAAVAAACGGFLPWNFPGARGFMGDAGSVPLGFLLGALCLVGALSGALPWPVALLVLAVFHIDAGLTLLRRLWRRERWYTAHREHVYQKLISKGWTHAKVALAYMALNAVLIAPAALLGTLYADLAGWLSAGTIAVLVIGWLAASSGLGGRL